MERAGASYGVRKETCRTVFVIDVIVYHCIGNISVLVYQQLRPDEDTDVATRFQLGKKVFLEVHLVKSATNLCRVRTGALCISNTKNHISLMRQH